jgi:hypothetical protein
MSRKKRITYIAYGSNMDKGQMMARCPEAKFIGTGQLENWKMRFKGSGSGAYATIEPDDPEKQTKLLVYIWSITAEDEKRLDYYEGFPRFYTKKEIDAILHGKKGCEPIKGMVYIMNDWASPGLPTRQYFNNIREIYEKHEWDDYVLWDGIDATVNHIRETYRRD